MTKKAARRSGVALVAALGLLVALTLVAPVGGAAAQPSATCDPTYGCTTTTTAAPINYTCHAVFSGTPGGPQSVTVTGEAPNTPVEVTFDGNVIASGETNSQGEATMAFQLPHGKPGSYVAVLVAGTYYAECDPPVPYDGGAGVLGVSQTNPSGTGVTGAGSGGVLAFTGMHLLLWLLIAAALVAVGALLRRASRIRRYR